MLGFEKMKKGKEHGEQVSSLGPMFPRLHVNDAADIGGPRAPPRNKMALYEQLSIPSQRFNPRLMPLSRNGATNLVSPALSSQGSGRDRGTVYPHLLPPSAPNHLSEKFRVNKSNTAQPSTSSSLMKPRKRTRAEEEFTVPVYVRLSSGLGRGHSGTNRNTSDYSMKIQNASNRHLSRDSQNPEVLDKQNGNSNRLQDVHTAETDKESGSRQKKDTHVGEVPRIPADDSCDLSRERTRVPLLVGVQDRGGEVSETSMIYSIPASDISPDDVVGIIGQKQFWKARKALVNQQRVFAVQVFELHRLIKVQRLIAESPHLLLEDLSLMVPASDKLTIEIIKPTARNPEHIEEPKKQGHRVEQSAGDGVLKTSVSSVVRSHHPRAGDPQLVPPVASDNNVSDFWAYHQQTPKHQWLIPVMSPSEGLVYKPYPGPAYLGPYNGQGPTPFMGNFVGPPYGVPSRFPSYGAPISGPDFSGSSVEQIHQFHRRPEEDSDMNMLQQSSCNDPRQKSRMAPPEKFRESEVQGSTGSNLSERPTEGVRGVLPLFPMIPPIAGGGSGTCESSQQPTRVIKVVPHNRRSASESAARIFRSIQEERKLYE